MLISRPADLPAAGWDLTRVKTMIVKSPCCSFNMTIFSAISCNCCNGDCLRFFLKAKSMELI